VAFTVGCAVVLLADVAESLPSDTTTAVPKPIKEPKEIKETATASKDLKDAVKAAKEAKKNKKDCAKECTEYDPICVHDPRNVNFKPRTFGSQCALDVYNCEMGSLLMTKQKGECPGSGGTRLS
ncbi:hypothetical protein WN55_02446, partial [Dufourea novaeangliae]